jgi:hypothetical protein
MQLHYSLRVKYNLSVSKMIMSNFLKNNKEKIVFVIFFIVNLLILNFSNYKDGGDDLFFRNSALNQSLLNFLVNRYFTWTGRMFPEFMAYFFDNSLVNIWPIINSFFITLLSYVVFTYVNLLIKIKIKQRMSLIYIIFLSFLLINKHVIEPAYIWRTGSINYLWPVTAGFLAFYPFLLSLKNKLNNKNNGLYLLVSILAAISSEQISVALIFGIIFYFGYMLVFKKKIPLIIYFLSFTILSGSLILFLAPGNQIRLQKESDTNFPGFMSLSIFNHISISLYWVLNKITNDLSLVLAPIFLILGLKSFKFSLKYISLLSLFLAFILLVKNIFGIQYKIYPITSDNYTSIVILIKYVLAISSLSLIPYLVFRLYKFSLKTTLIYLVVLLVLIQMTMITLSPTLDISGSRTIFLPSIILNVLSIFLIFDHIS